MKTVKRFRLVGLASLVVAFSVTAAGVASASNPPVPTQTAAIALSPSKLPKSVKKRKSVAMTVTTTTDETSCDGVACNSLGPFNGPYAVPTPARKAYVSFDPDIAFTPGSATICNNRFIWDLNYNSTGTTNQQARVKCPTSVIGEGTSANGGGAVVKIPNDSSPSYTQVTPEITAFRVPDVGGKPAIVLYVYVPQLGGFVQKLQGVLKDSPIKGYGKMLEVTIPPLAASAALTSFKVTVGQKFTPVKDGGGNVIDSTTTGTKSGFVKAACADKKTKISGRFDYWGGWRSVSEANKLSATATGQVACSN